MGNTQSRILGSVYYVAYSLSALITLVCLFNIPRAQVFLQVQPVHAQAPTITADGTPITTMGTTGTFGFLGSAKLDSSQSVVLIVDFSNGVLLASAAPYAYDKRTTGNANRASMCSFDGKEVSSSATSNIYCRRSGTAADTFLAFKYTDLSPVQDGSSNNPLYVSAGTILGRNGMLTVAGSFMFVASEQLDSTLYRIDLSTTFTYTGTVTSTKSVQDTSAATEQYRHGVCDSNGFCYAASKAKKLAKFTQDTSGSPTYVSPTLDLSQSGQLDTGTFNSNENVVLDSVGNNLFVATTATGYQVAKIDLGTFSYVSKVTLTTDGFISATSVALCENCLTAGIGGETYMMVMSYTAAKDARFIKLSDMSEVTDAGSFINTADAVTGWLTTTPGAGHGGIVTADTFTVQKLTTTGVVGTTSTTTTTTTTTSTTTTSTPAPGNNNQQQQQGSSSDQGVVVIATTGSILAVILIAAIGFIIYKFGFASSSNDAESGDNTEPTTAVENNNDEELKEVK